MKYLIINDNHLGLRRRAGVTPNSLASFYLQQFQILDSAVATANKLGRQLIVLGDLFDSSGVDYSIVWNAREALAACTAPPILCRGNHDVCRKTEKMSGFDFLCLTLPNAIAVTSPHELEPRCTIIPHLLNQEAFDNALAVVVGGTLLLHCNYDNFFAESSDHSLNISQAQAEKFDHLIIAHEHNKKYLPGVDVLGAPLPCKIDESAVKKGFHLWDGPGHDLEFVETYSPENSYIEVDWKEIESTPSEAEFIKVIGQADFDQGAAVIQAVAQLRKNHSSFMIQNGVKVGDLVLSELEEIEDGFESFDAEAVFWGLLSEKTANKVKEVLG